VLSDVGSNPEPWPTGTWGCSGIATLSWDGIPVLLATKWATLRNRFVKRYAEIEHNNHLEWLPEPPDKAKDWAMYGKHEFPQIDDQKNDNASRHRLLEPAEFCRLLLSRRQLVRFNGIAAGVLGLLDPITDEVFQVHAAALERYAERLVGS
jgi:hypothetical protein